MKKAVLFVGLLFLSLSNFAQDKASLIGKWTFKDVLEKESLEADELKMVMTMFKDLSLEFKETDVVLSMMGKSEAAPWSFDPKDTKIINTTSKTGKQSQITISKFDAKEMVITIGRVGPFVMSKS